MILNTSTSLNLSRPYNIWGIMNPQMVNCCQNMTVGKQFDVGNGFKLTGFKKSKETLGVNKGVIQMMLRING